MSENFFDPNLVYDNANSIILELYEKEKTILDIGCGTGLLARQIRTIRPDSYIVGLDISKEVIGAATENLDEFHCIDLDTGKLPVFERNFDLIILGDVLEHLKRPDLLLQELHACLKENGKIIVSVPNVALATVRCQLLMGHFDYEKTGILDNTHLRFFTYRSIRQLIESSGYTIRECRCRMPEISRKVAAFMAFCNLFSIIINKRPMKRSEWACSQFMFKLEQKQ